MNSLRGIPPAALMAVALAATVSGYAQTGTPAPTCQRDWRGRAPFSRRSPTSLPGRRARRRRHAGRGPLPRHRRHERAHRRRRRQALRDRLRVRLPAAWSGRFYYQANGGVDGAVVLATGPATASLAAASALVKGFAVVSSDAGHAAAQNGSFGTYPRARLDHGYGAVAALTPMAKEVIRVAYGRGPDRSYIGGCSNGGRHALVAAARMAGAYDGFLAGDPGTVLPRAAVANLLGGKAYAGLAGDLADPGAGFTLAAPPRVRRGAAAMRRARRCRRRHGPRPTCIGARDGTCFSGGQFRLPLRLARPGARSTPAGLRESRVEQGVSLVAEESCV